MTGPGKIKTSSTRLTSGKDGEVLLARGDTMAMRLWRNEAPHDKAPRSSPYETLGYVVSGRAELTIAGEAVLLNAGDSYRVPKDADHTYRILEPFTAVECTSPPAKD